MCTKSRTFSPELYNLQSNNTMRKGFPISSIEKKEERKKKKKRPHSPILYHLFENSLLVSVTAIV